MIGMEHHLLIAHIHPFITSGHCVGDREEVAAKLADAGLRYMFVGHSHIQRIDTFVSPSAKSDNGSEHRLAVRLSRRR